MPYGVTWFVRMYPASRLIVGRSAASLDATSAWAASRVIPSRVPVSTNVMPTSGPSAATAGAAIGAQIGVTAVKYIRGYGIRLLFAIMILLPVLLVNWLVFIR